MSFNFRYFSVVFFFLLFNGNLPFRAFIMPDVASGILPPAAKTPMPITMSLMWNVSPVGRRWLRIKMISLAVRAKYIVLTAYGQHPGHDVRTDAYPDDAHDERERVDFSFRSAVRHGHRQNERYRQGKRPPHDGQYALGRFPYWRNCGFVSLLVLAMLK